MTQPRNLVLLVEDSEVICKLAEALMRLHCSKYKILLAPTMEVAMWTFSKYKRQIRVVLLDGSLNSERKCDTLPLVIAIQAAKIKGEFHGEAIAISADPDHNNLLIKAGCTDALEYLRTSNFSTIKLEVLKKVARELCH